MFMDHQLLRLPDLLSRRGDSRSNFYRDIADGLWTEPVALGPRYSAWPAHEAEALIRARIAGATPDEIRNLVRLLMKQRKELMPRVPRIDASAKPRTA